MYVSFQVSSDRLRSAVLTPIMPLTRRQYSHAPASPLPRLSLFIPVITCSDMLFHCADTDSAKLCQTVCMLQYFPLHAKENLTDCPACIDQQPEEGYAQYDNVHAILEVHVNRSSLLPEVMRLRWFPTTSDPIFAQSGIQVQLTCPLIPAFKGSAICLFKAHHMQHNRPALLTHKV